MQNNHRLTAALAAIDEFVGAARKSDWNADPMEESRQLLIAAKARGLMSGYHARWQHAGYEAILVEQTLEAPLTNPETGRNSKTFRLAGKLDVLALDNGRRVLFDHKTTSQDITDPNGPYWRQLVVEGQASHYYLLSGMNNLPVDNAVWDAIRKPSIAPKKLSKAERASIASSGQYFGLPVSDEDRRAVQTEERESPSLYALRLEHDCTVERPEWYFQRRAVPRVNHEIVEYAGELWEHAQEMLATRQRSKITGKLPPRNSGACLQFNSPCAYLGVCSGYDEITSDKWAIRESVHSELPGIPGDGKKILTNSRVRCYQTCRRREYYRYQLGVERVDEEEKEALWFGSCMHEGLRVWWETFLIQEKENVSSSNSTQVTGIWQAGSEDAEPQLAG